ncbi:MAG TPA: isopentenyl-diphosphate Delta-isomerase [Gemmataceae bacterium]|nr:isopentenyl-diphosphate Delta-isomerase [Gemmataceae bacterium]
MSHPEPPSPPDLSRQVILCDVTGCPTGTAELVAAHTGAGHLHLAFSVYVFSPDRRSLLIQQRSRDKRLWPLVWANTCCSHPRAGEVPVAAGRRRLREEMGIDCELTPGPAFVYRAEDPAGRGIEHEYDVILIGTYAGDPTPDPSEVADWEWVSVADLRRDMQQRPERYAPWLHLGLPKVLSADAGR